MHASFLTTSLFSSTAYATNSLLSFKIRYGQELRRFSVPSNITFEQLIRLVVKCFTLAPESVLLQYLDDEDELITIASDLELSEAVRLQQGILRFIVQGNLAERLPLSCAFVGDTNFPPGARIMIGARFVKTWKVRNDGRDSWPQGCFVALADPKYDEGLRVCLQSNIPFTVSPGEEVDVSVEVEATQHPGRYLAYWRLSTAHGEQFGAKLVLDVNVVVDAIDTNLLTVVGTDLPHVRKDLPLDRLEEEEQTRKKAEEEQARKRAEEEQARKRTEEEQEQARKKAEEEQARKRVEEEQEQAKKRAEEQARKRAEEEQEQARKRAEEEEEERKKAEEEQARKKAEEEEQARAKAKEEARKKAEEEQEQARKRAEEEQEQAKKEG